MQGQNSEFEFKVGQAVRLSSGWSPQVVLSVNDENIAVMYWSAYKMWKADGATDKQLRHSAETKIHARNRLVPYFGDPDKYDHRVTSTVNRAVQERALKAHLNQTSQTETKTMINKPALYQTSEPTPRFGTYLTTNSNGQFVLEMKGENGKVEAFDEADLEKVTPYTIRTAHVRGDSRHFQVAKTLKIAKGDWLMLPDGMRARVTQLDSKSEGADVLPEGTVRLLTEPLS